MKKQNKIISLLMATLLSCSIFAGCNDKGKEKEIVPEQVKTSFEKPTFENTDIDLVKEGKTEYVIVYPENASSQTKTGIQELQLFFKEATGIELQTYSDANYVEKANSKFISVGQTTQFKDLDIDLASYNLGASGYVIKYLWFRPF